MYIFAKKGKTLNWKTVNLWSVEYTCVCKLHPKFPNFLHSLQSYSMFLTERRCTAFILTWAHCLQHHHQVT